MSQDRLAGQRLPLPSGFILFLVTAWVVELLSPPLVLANDGFVRSVVVDASDVARFAGFSHDGGTAIAINRSGRVLLWDMATGRPRGPSRHREGERISLAALAHDGKALATTGSECDCSLWEVETGKKRAEFRGHAGSVDEICFCPDGRLVATGSRDQTIKLWEMPTGRELRTLRGHNGWVECLAFSPDGHTLASGSDDQSARVWDACTGEAVAILRGHSSWVQSVAFSPDGRLLATGSCDETVKVWDARTGRELTTLSGHQASVRAVVFSPDGKTLASGSEDNTIKLWDVPTFTERATLRGDAQGTCSLAFGQRGNTLLAAGTDGTVVRWHLYQPDRGGPKPPQRLVTEALDRLLDASGTDAAQAYSDMRTLVAAPGQSTRLIATRARPRAKPSKELIDRWLHELDDEKFSVREQAASALEEAETIAREPLLQALTVRQTPEAQLRIENLLEELQPGRSLTRLRAARVTEVLEAIGDAKALNVLESLATGADELGLTQEAKASVARLKRPGR